jgi:leader peptidase (prepilin peptidase)/N-methyltransferase
MILAMTILLLLCWGSFLNVVGHRLITNQDIIFLRSHCPHCDTTLAWYDLIPLFSWIWLRGRCRYCHEPISYLYPFIELLTVIIGLLLFTCVESQYWIAYFFFFSALIVTIRTDLEHMLISQYMTIYLIPLSVACAAFGLLPITLTDSIAGAIGGYAFLYFMGYVARKFMGKEALGEGDLDLLALIGSCTGIIGCWLSLTIGALLGSIIGGAYLIFSRQDYRNPIPFGPFLAAGAIAYVIFENALRSFLLCE